MKRVTAVALAFVASAAYADWEKTCDDYVTHRDTGAIITNERGEPWCVGYVYTWSDSGNDSVVSNQGNGEGPPTGQPPSTPPTGTPPSTPPSEPPTSGPPSGPPVEPPSQPPSNDNGPRNGKADGTNPGNPDSHDKGRQGHNNPNNARK